MRRTWRSCRAAGLGWWRSSRCRPPTFRRWPTRPRSRCSPSCRPADEVVVPVLVVVEGFAGVPAVVEPSRPTRSRRAAAAHSTRSRWQAVISSPGHPRLAAPCHVIFSPAKSCPRQDPRRAARSRVAAEGRAAVLAGARGRQRGADLPEALDAHARLVRVRRARARWLAAGVAGRRAAAIARRGPARHGLCALAPRRRDRRAHRAGRDAQGAGRAQQRPRREHAHGAPPSLPGARRPGDPARGAWLGAGRARGLCR